MATGTEPFAVGHRVTYLPGRHKSGTRLCRRGVVTGAPVFDAYTNNTWVPVHAEGQASDQEPEWVRASDIVDVA
ncbi:hypothetical protein [Amycolatopsis alkalitolerans]|uniref:Uncharacterized protein n=1 Tax=Amycolatopsis alkalitolerans TaxID=2547244 RepID=A0A5C4LYX2_9PSEU|nr:hypothetical protein [Amycolatopsis alkalitolerans]TNC24205.1 hypothetical protein FG385_19325 [Amycolatopsis alkalitolerans]